MTARTMGALVESLGRNDACHCGSGRKYKKCCLPSDEPWRPQSEPERTAVMMVQLATSQQGGGPSCPGPVVVHETGAFECRGPSCPGTAYRRHGPGVPRACPAGQSELATTCRRCVDDVTVFEGAPGAAVCPGMEVDHIDGSVTCTEGRLCLGAESLHAQGMTCSLLSEPCGVCA
jgi:hypothetical protein